MNNHDWDNLQFLLNADKEALRIWYESVDKDDIDYAAEIMRQYSEELATRQRFIDVENLDSDKITSDTKNYLSNFRLKK